MKREIKFRGWHREAKDMVYFGLGEDNIPAYNIEVHDCYTFRVEDGHPIMEFTGLLDKNGVEIYEGDVVRVDWGDTRYEPQVGVVSWDMKDAAFYFGFGSTGEVGWTHEVIGNMHENPELIGGDNA